MSYDVFISYSAEDKPTADAVVAGLENHRIRCWIAPRDIGAGKEYGAEIIAGITRCKVMVLIFSMRSNNSNQVVREVERFVADQGWNQNPRLFALARTADLVKLEPALAEALGAQADDPDSITPIEQETLDASKPLDEVLATTMWPDDVVGAALVLERLILPPEAEAALPVDDEESLHRLIAEHPERQDVRMAVVVLRDGQRECAIRLKTHDDDASVLLGPDLIPRLAQALAATLM